MIRSIPVALFLILALPMAAAAAPGEEPATLTIEPRKTIRVFDDALLGVNDSWPELAGLNRLTGPAPLLRPKCGTIGIVASQMRPTLFRMAGVDSQFLDWKKNPGSGYAVSAGAGTSRVGLLRHLASIRRQNPDAGYIWTVNMVRNTPEDARDLAEFLAGGFDTLWGKLRIDLGCPEPMPPAIWELGDELDYNYSRFGSASACARECQRYIFAIRSVIPDARFAVPAVTAPWTERSKGKLPEFNRLLLDALAGEIDFLSFHPYLRDLPPAVAEPYFDLLAREIADSRNPGIRLLVTEPALPLSGTSGNLQARRLRSESLAGCLEEAEWFLFLLNRPEVGAATLFHLPPGIRAMTATAGALPSEPGTAKPYRFLRRIPPDSELLRSTLSGDAATFGRGQTLGAAALKSPDGKELYLLFNNLSPDTARPTVLRFLREREWQLESAVCLSAPELASRNTETEQPIAETVLPTAPGEPLSKLTIPPKSLVLATLKRMTKEEGK